MQIINNEMNDLEEFKKENFQQYKEEFEFFKKEFESIKQLIINYGTNDIWSKISYVCDDDNMYTINEEDTGGLAKQKLITDDQKKNFNSRLMEKFAGIFNGEIKIKKCEKIMYGINIIIDNECFCIQRNKNSLILSNFKIKGKTREHYLEIRYIK